jgi:hypothetical protein
VNPASALFSAMALLPAMTGPLPDLARDGGIIVSLCSGGTVSIPLSGHDIPRGDTPCCTKGCRTDEKRKRFDSKQ